MASSDVGEMSPGVSEYLTNTTGLYQSHMIVFAIKLWTEPQSLGIEKLSHSPGYSGSPWQK